MPANPPLTASGPRALKCPRPLARNVREAVGFMVWGRVDDPEGRPLNFVDAARAAGVKPDVMRRWLDRPEVHSLLRAERKAFRATLCAGNEGALRRVRDTAANPMAVVASVRALDQMQAEEEGRAPPGAAAPGVTINIVTERATPVTIDGRAHIPVPFRAAEPEPDPEPDLNPVFKSPDEH